MIDNKDTPQERYRLKNKEYYAKASLKYYHNNKEKCAEKARKWRLANLDYIRVKQKEDKRKRKDEAIAYLGSVCNHCQGKFHPAIYEFHHLDPSTKDRDPSKMLQLRWERLKEELDKCILLCANCHRLTHHEDSYEI